MSLARAYGRFRNGPAFLIALAVFILSMLGLHFVIGVDRDWGGTNLFLSIEASVFTAVMQHQMRAGNAAQKRLGETIAARLDALAAKIEAALDD